MLSPVERFGIVFFIQTLINDMKKIIDFDPSLRTEIESGKYEVQTRNGLEATIIDWERKCYDREHDLVVKVKGKNKKSENVFYYYQNGRLISDSTTGPKNSDLVLVYEEEKEETRTPFSQYRPALESGDLVAVTEFGEPAEIVKWDCEGKYPILAAIYDGDTTDACFYDESGTSSTGSKLIVKEKFSIQYPEGFVKTVCEYLEGFIKDQCFPRDVLEAADKLLKACGTIETKTPGTLKELEDTAMSYLYSSSTSYSQDKAREIVKSLCDISRRLQFKVEAADQNVPLSEDEKLVKDAILHSVGNGKLGNVEVKSITTYLRKLFALEKPKPSEEPDRIPWKQANDSSEFYIPQYVVRKSIFGKNKLVKTRKVKKGEYYCPIDKIYGNQSN